MLVDMRPHTLLALIVAAALPAATALVSPPLLPWALPVLPVLAWLLNHTRWTSLVRLRAIQAAAAGQTVAVAAVLLKAPLPLAIPGVALFALAAIATGYGVVKFPARTEPR
ncbi:hypothetical protein ACTG9Q_06810 [Actinokineospora sp. 24-640]